MNPPTDTHRCLACEALIPQDLDVCDLCWIAERRGMNGSDASHLPTPQGYLHRMDDPVGNLS